jgi:hypothetical protein
VPIARIGDKLLFFVHVPKTGGTSIEAYLRAKGPLALAGTRRHGWSRTTPQHMHREIFNELVPPAFYDQGFAVLREPKARLLSEFRMRAEPLSAKLRPVGLARAAWKRMQGIHSYGVRIGNRIEFLDFDAWVERSFAEYRKDPFYKDNHFRPQHEFVDRSHRIFLFEDGIDPVFRWIDAVTGTPPVEGSFHERRSAPLPIECSAATDALIRDFYREDHALIDALRAGRDAAA